MATDALMYIESKFYADFPKHENEAKYNFSTQSTFKATRIHALTGSVNQIPGECTVEGDVRVTPFYNVSDVRVKLNSYIDEINADPTILHQNYHGPHSKYVLYDDAGVITEKGKLELVFSSDGENGVACNLESPGFKALKSATEAIVGTVAPYGIGGSLPLIRELQEKGFDVQIAGYGLSSRFEEIMFLLSCDY
jgi:acetylornithine deacetylase